MIYDKVFYGTDVGAHDRSGQLWRGWDEHNYIPGIYGDLALAVEPSEGISVRNDLYYYSVEAGRSVRSGQIEADADVTLVYDFLNLFYKPGIRGYGWPGALLRVIISVCQDEVCDGMCKCPKMRKILRLNGEV